MGVLLVIGDPRMILLMNWLSGSTYALTADDARLAWLLGLLLLAVVPLASRWLAILPLGDGVGSALGLGIERSRLLLLLLTAGLTAVATLLIGPLSFVGLMAPHLARLLGLARPMPQVLASALLGGFVMVLADWLGRQIAFPLQLPAGLVASLLGGAYTLWLMRRS
ncbi:iron chelate uptake ABC transporter family permease subunit [Acetobacteraceae bacterium H6797]|nr:iron chelate uptake ABC transporter family permease subunit [Acetobacteraceae bacterium H6797]